MCLCVRVCVGVPRAHFHETQKNIMGVCRHIYIHFLMHLQKIQKMLNFVLRSAKT